MYGAYPKNTVDFWLFEHAWYGFYCFLVNYWLILFSFTYIFSLLPPIFSFFFFFFFLHTLFLYTHRLSDMFTSVFLPSKFIFLISSLVLHSIFFPSFTLPSHYFWNLLLFAWPIVRGFFSGPENIYWKGDSCSHLRLIGLTVVEG